MQIFLTILGVLVIIVIAAYIVNDGEILNPDEEQS